MYSCSTPSGQRKTLLELNLFEFVGLAGFAYTLGALMNFPRTSSFAHHQPVGYASARIAVTSALQGGSFPLYASLYMISPIATWRMLLWHCTIAACRRAPCSAGRSSATRIAMIPITTRSSTSVNAFDKGLQRVRRFMN